MNTILNTGKKLWATTVCSLFTLLLSLFTASCTSESYESGDGDYSNLHADFVELHTSAPKLVDYIITDDGYKYNFTDPKSLDWAEKGDTLYRALTYYNIDAKGTELVAAGMVYVLKPKDADKVEDPKTDPVTVESIWLSKCRRQDINIGTDADGKPLTADCYLNLSLLVKTGQPAEQNAQHSIGAMKSISSDGVMTITFLHDQGNMPAYYNTRLYVSIPLAESQLTTPATLLINTFEGMRTLHVSKD